MLSSEVREIGVTRLERDRATLLVFVDQSTTRADQGQPMVSGRGSPCGWRAGKITDFDFLNQPLPGGGTEPRC